jgi:hypothetical protein
MADSKMSFVSIVYAKTIYSKKLSTSQDQQVGVGIGINHNITKILFLIDLHNLNNITQDKT